MAFSLTAITFDDTQAGQLSKHETVTITNLGDIPLKLGAATVDSSEFLVDSIGCLITELAAGASCALSLTFRPSVRRRQSCEAASFPSRRTAVVSLGTSCRLPSSL